MSVLIRTYRPDDRPTVVHLLVALQDHIAKLDPYKINKTAAHFDGDGYLEHVLQKSQRENGLMLVAEIDGVVVGCIACSDDSEENPIDHYPTKQASIDELIVDDTTRGKGIGSLLMKESERIYRDRGYEYLNVICFTPNTNAYRFYRRIGYEDRFTSLKKKL